MNKPKLRMKRRDFLRLAAMTGGTAVLAACAPEVIKETVEVEVEKTVEVEVERTVEVEVERTVQVEVEKVVTATPEPGVEVGKWLFGETLEGPEYILDPAEWPTTFNEAPMLAELVEAGKLPPVEERLPKDLLVIKPVHEIGAYGGIVRRGFTGPGDNQNGGRFAQHDQLLFWNYQVSEVRPGVAKGWELSDDGQVTTLYLREGLKWSDGAPCTADDIMFWYEHMCLNEELVPSFPVELIAGDSRGVIEKVDDYTVRYVFPEPYFLFPRMLAGLNFISGHALGWGQGAGGIAPAHYLEQFHPDFASPADLDRMVAEAGVESWVGLFDLKNSPNTNPDCPGLAAWITKVPNNTPVWVLERNPYWYGVDTEGNQLPYIDEIVMTVVESNEVLNLRAISGEYDYQARHLMLDKLPVFLENRERGNYSLRLVPAQFGSECGVIFNMNYDGDPEIAKWLLDLDFRRALSLGIDRDQINEAFFMGVGRTGSIIPPDYLPDYPGDEYLTLWHYLDPEEANQMLDEMGLDKKDADGYRLRTDNGERLRLEIYAQTPAGINVVGFAEMISEHWKTNLGIFTDIEVVDPALQTQRYLDNVPQMTIWQASNEMFENSQLRFPDAPGSVLGPLYGAWFLSGGTEGKEPPPRMRQLMEMWHEGRTVPDDERNEMGKEMWKIVVEELWTIGNVGIAPGFMGLLMYKNGLGNIPDRLIMTSRGQTPGHFRPETFYWKE